MFSRKFAVLVVLAMLALVLVGAAWFVFSPRSLLAPPETISHKEAVKVLTSGPTGREAVRLIAVKNTALAALENGDFPEADRLFVEIAGAVPGDPVGSRNLLITRLLALQKFDFDKDPQSAADAVARALHVVTMERDAEGSDWVANYLPGKLAWTMQSNERALGYFRLAARSGIGDPSLLYDLFLAAQSLSEDAIHKEGDFALDVAQKVAPDNFFLLLERLRRQTVRHEPEARQTFDKTKELLARFDRGLGEKSHIRLAGLVDEASRALEKKDWQTALRQVQTMIAALAADPIVQWDKRQVTAGVLRLAVLDFFERFYKERNLLRAFPAHHGTANFREVSPAGPLGEINDARAARFVRGDGSGPPEIAVLRTARFEMFRFEKATGIWTLSAEASLPHDEFDHLEELPVSHEPTSVQERAQDPTKSAVAKRIDANEFLLFGRSGIVVLRSPAEDNAAARRFERIVPHALNQKIHNPRDVVPVDLNDDGRLDLVISSDKGDEPTGISVWLNRGQGEYTDVTGRAQLGEAPLVPTSLTAVNWNQDSDMDVAFVDARGSTKLGLLNGEGFGRFRVEPIKAKAKPFQSAACLAVLDVDQNGSWDLIAGGPEGIGLLTTHHNKTIQVEVDRNDTLSDFRAQNLLVFDYDNDGLADLIASNPDGFQCFHGREGGRLETTPDLLPAGLKPFSAVAAADFNSDGNEDLLFVGSQQNDRRIVLLQNDGRYGNNWIDIAINGPAAGVGSAVQLRAGIAYPSQVIRGPVTHFGIGQLETVDVIRVTSPDGLSFNQVQPPKNGLLRVTVPPNLKAK